jgi:hypothetical protein
MLRWIPALRPQPRPVLQAARWRRQAMVTGPLDLTPVGQQPAPEPEPGQGLALQQRKRQGVCLKLMSTTLDRIGRMAAAYLCSMAAGHTDSPAWIGQHTVTMSGPDLIIQRAIGGNIGARRGSRSAVAVYTVHRGVEPCLTTNCTQPLSGLQLRRLIVTD